MNGMFVPRIRRRQLHRHIPHPRKVHGSVLLLTKLTYCLVSSPLLPLSYPPTPSILASIVESAFVVAAISDVISAGCWRGTSPSIVAVDGPVAVVVGAHRNLVTLLFCFSCGPVLVR